ncbi:hypothetical protein ACFPFV_12985 [Salinicoccus siamensis]|uniref:hypothetical protein n=1 Tax=Salinicoccus siamensis TaxID=381830 RepID=UPI0036124354
MDMGNITEIPYTTPEELDEHMLHEMTLDAMADGQVGVLLMAGGQGPVLSTQDRKALSRLMAIPYSNCRQNNSKHSRKK